LVLASVITLVALPAIWLANRDDEGSSTRPNVAAVGIDPGRADADADATDAFDPMGTTGAAYLDPVAGESPQATAGIVIGTSADDVIGVAHASYRRTAVVFDTCQFNGLPGGEEVTVVNVANGRSTQCTIVNKNSLADGELLLSQGRFQRIAELTSAPIHVQIRK
jgi:hypothetical protein